MEEITAGQQVLMCLECNTFRAAARVGFHEEHSSLKPAVVRIQPDSLAKRLLITQLI